MIGPTPAHALRLNMCGDHGVPKYSMLQGSQAAADRLYAETATETAGSKGPNAVLDEGDDGLAGDRSAEAQTGAEDHPGEGSTASTEEKDEKATAEPTEKKSSEESPATHSESPKEDSTSTNSTSDSMSGTSLLRGAEVTLVDVLAMHGRAAGTVMNWYPTIINTMLTRTTTTQAAESATASQTKASEAAAAPAESAAKAGDKSSHAPAEQV